MTKKFLLQLCTLLLVLVVRQLHAANDASESLKHVADQYQNLMLTYYQPYVYFSKIDTNDHDRFLTNNPELNSKYNAQIDELLETVHSINDSKLPTSAERVFLAKLREELESSVGLRVCNSELWNIDHMFGTDKLLAIVAQNQPVGSAKLEADAIARWRSVGEYYRQEILNLQAGLKRGYSAPQTVVQRVIGQLDNLLAMDVDSLPFMAVAKRAESEKFAADFEQILVKHVLPAISEYRDFLREDYVSKARKTLGIGTLPEGRKCYMAKYRSYTTLTRTPEEVFELGLITVNKRKEEVERLGRRLFDLESFDDIIVHINKTSEPDFKSEAELAGFYQEIVARSKVESAKCFTEMPDAELLVEPIPLHQQGFGREAFYIPQITERRASFLYDPSSFATQKFGAAEIIAVHEGYPGHHMQIASANAIEMYHPVEAMFSNSAYSEGWGRYSEQLAEEMGLFKHETAKVLRRAWPARGMVADPALHILGWSKEKVVQFLKASGSQYTNDIDALLDRMAIWPGQLTAYDSGALEILALKSALEDDLGDKFDIKEFHRRVLKNGGVPMSMLRKQVLENY